MIQSVDLYIEIQEMIYSHREDDYWDFKKCHHSNTAKLLHDIICMANNRANRDAYIIFGVEDVTYKIIGVESDEYRRTQQQMVDQLKSKKFAAGIRPKIEMCTFTMDGHEVDVLIIKNTLDTPYYLIEDYRDDNHKVRANHIYTRVCDTNTDIDKSADINHVEYLWKKRFALHMTPFDKLRHLLQNKTEWVRNEKSDYNINNPEFTITIEYDHQLDDYNPMFYSYVMTNSSTSYKMLKVNYFGTTIYSHQTVILDSGRYITVTPFWEYLSFRNQIFVDVAFKYFVKEHISYSLHEYLFDEDREEAYSARRRFLKVIIIFESESEKKSFTTFVKSNEEEYSKLMHETNDIDIYDPVDNELARAKYIAEIKTGIVLNQMLAMFRDGHMKRGEQ